LGFALTDLAVFLRAGFFGLAMRSPLKLAQVSFRSYCLIAIRCPAMSAESTFPLLFEVNASVAIEIG
jgi:hypothetical protein